jgi:hypothetical protein
MDINFNVNIKRKYKVNGQEYNSLEEMPADVREVLKKAMHSKADTGTTLTTEKSHTRIIFNGKEYDSFEAMPADVRQTYDKILKSVETGEKPDIGLSDISNTFFTESGKPQMLNDTNMIRATRFESSFISGGRAFLIGIVVAALIFIIYMLLQNK